MKVKQRLGMVINQMYSTENINGPTVIKVPEWVNNKIGNYYMYFSDHQGKYIKMAVADHIEGSWNVIDHKPLYVDDTPCNDHIASPEIYIDNENQLIYMYYHGMISSPRTGFYQNTLYAVSKDGLSFKAESNKIIETFYFRLVKYGTVYYGISKIGNDGCLYSTGTSLTDPFIRSNILIPNCRHASLYLDGNVLYTFYTHIGDRPERILYNRFTLPYIIPNTLPQELLRPQEYYEGIDIPLTHSQPGKAHGREQALRDPYVIEDGGKLYMFYVVAGESGIALAELERT